jgi:hypothetical protein
MKNRQNGQFVGKLANRLKFADSLVLYPRIREFDELAISVNSWLQERDTMPHPPLSPLISTDLGSIGISQKHSMQ